MCQNRHILFYFVILLSEEKHRTKGRRSQGAIDYSRGWTPPAPDRREAPLVIAQQQEKSRRDDRPQTGVLTPGTSALTKLSPERATEYITCLISNCLYLCRPFRTFHVVAQSPGVYTPVCGLSRLRRFSPDTNILFCNNHVISFTFSHLPAGRACRSSFLG